MKFFNENYMSFAITTVLMNGIECILSNDNIQFYGDEEYSDTLTHKYLMYDTIKNINYNLFLMHAFYMYIYMLHLFIHIDHIVDFHINSMLVYTGLKYNIFKPNLYSMNTWLCLFGCNTIHDCIYEIYKKIK